MFFHRYTVGQDTASNDRPLQVEVRTVSTDAAGNASDKTQCLAVRLYNGTGSAQVTGRPYAVECTGAEATQWQTITPAALAVYQHVVIALEDVAAASFGWYAIQGFCDALVDGTTDVADLDYLDVTPGTSATALIKDHSTVRSTASVARACEARTDNSAGLIRVQLLGDRVIIP